MGKTIDGITRTASALTGTERFALRDGTPDPTDQLDAKATISQITTYLQTGVLDTYINNLIATDRTTQRRGTIQLWGAAAVPTGAFLCDGQAVSRTTYAALFAIIGTTFGAGDNSTTFNVPNFQGVVPKGVGSQDINGRTKTGPALGVVEEDQGQLLTGEISFRKYAASAVAVAPIITGVFKERQTGEAGYETISSTGTQRNLDKIIFGSDGSPDARTGATTRENSLGINFIIWY